MKKVFAIALLTLALVTGLEAQTPAVSPRLVLSPVPLWPANGDTSQLPKGQYVFYDPSAAEYVVYYAGNSAGLSSAQPTIVRFATHSLVDPQVTSTVGATSDGRFQYTYKVENGGGALQSIGRISILDYSDNNPLASGINWTAHVEPHKEFDLATPAFSASAIEWTSNSSASSIAPGTVMQGLAIVSTSLPGIVSITFRGDSKSTEYTPDAAASLPKEARDQLAAVMTPTWDARSTMVIGPRFAKKASPSTIAQNYSFGIQWLIRRRKLDGNSAFVQQAQALFHQQLQAGDQTLLNAASLAFTKDAKTDLEKEIANALVVAFAQ